MAQAPALKQMLPSVRALLILISVLQIVVGPLLFLLPGHTDRLFAWTIKPSLTAAFFGANYLTALVIVLLTMREQVWTRAQAAYPGMFVFTTLTTLATLIHRDKFHFHTPGLAARATTWVWFIFYIVVPPLMLVVLFLQVRAPGNSLPRSGPLPVWMRLLLSAEGIGMMAVGSALFIAPVQTSRIWPWMLTPLTSRAVGAWLAGFGLAAACAAWENAWERSRLAMVGNLVFGVLQLITLARYTDTVTWDTPNGWIYLGFLVYMLVSGLYGAHIGYRVMGGATGMTPVGERPADQPT